VSAGSGNAALLNAAVDRINRERPDLTLFGGDLIEEAKDLPAALDAVTRIQSPVFGVPGNHDYWSHADFGPIADAFKATGGAWLVDASAVALGDRLHVAGFSCQTHAPALAPVQGRFNLALVHYPLWANRIPAGFDFILAGHSHGGQVRLPLFGPLITPMGVGSFDYGRFDAVAGPLYVSSGVGTFLMNVRFLCPPEVVFLEI
jgi:predicted MPP superfamily phosphohydrolase